MPIYEYQCQACGELLEKLQKISDAPLVDCPACGKAELKKKISAAAFRLKGGGWYETDFKTGDKKKNLAGDAATADSASKEAPAKEAAPKSEPAKAGAAKADAAQTQTAKKSGGKSGSPD